jgi:hypothetical protein
MASSLESASVKKNLVTVYFGMDITSVLSQRGKFLASQPLQSGRTGAVRVYGTRDGCQHIATLKRRDQDRCLAPQPGARSGVRNEPPHLAACDDARLCLGKPHRAKSFELKAEQL